MPAGKIHNLSNLCFRDLVAEHTNNRNALFVDGQHNFERLGVGQAKEPFQHLHDEFHRRVVIVQQKHLIQRGSFGFGFYINNNRRIPIAVLRKAWARGHACRAIGETCHSIRKLC